LAEALPRASWDVIADRGPAGDAHIADVKPPALEALPAGHQWQRRPLLSLLVRASVVVVPALAGIAAGTIVSRLLPTPSGFGAAALSFSAVSVAMLVTIIALERAGRRLLPLAALLNLSLLFPDRAPKRFAVARRVGKPRDLQRQLQEAHEKGVTGGEVAHMQRVLELVAALSVHDRQTRGHSERVRVFSDLIADELNLPPADRARLRWASLLHDIGKLVVPAAILTKPARLTNTEMDTVRRHPDEGARLLGPLAAWLGPWALAVAEHHERFDGRGYPRGLAGEHISLAGRIVAVADSYEVMTAMRPYSKPIGVSAARQELVRCSGAQFDPVVVRAFLNISMGRLWRVVGLGSWIAQLPFIGWIDRLGWNWGAAIMSGTTAIGLTVPGALPRTMPTPAPTQAIAVVSTGGGTAPRSSGSGTGSPGGGTSGHGVSPPSSGAPPGAGSSGSGGSTGSTGGTTGTGTGPNPGNPTSPSPAPTSPTGGGTPTPSPTTAPMPIPTPTPPPDEPPVVTVRAGGLAVLGNFSGSGSFTDADFAGHTFTATVNYGDDTGTQSLTLNGATFSLSHTYRTLLKKYTITVTVTDNDGVWGRGSTTVTTVL
jgi:HD-GYP domain-containing protein (c-di-GMP phosphodiesterase class II)